jgi:hypothetical protein
VQDRKVHVLHTIDVAPAPAVDGAVITKILRHKRD